MTGSVTPSLVAVDWGTSHLRVWLLDAQGAVLAEHRSDEGMGATAREQFQSVLEAHLAALTVPADVPVVMCGMVGSRQGWVEARYLTVPVSLADVAAAAVRIPGVDRDIRIMPGLSRTDRQSPDVMRGEETQLLGVTRLAPIAGERFVCMPGTHSKWVRMSGDSVLDFVTFLTGEAFAILSHHSVLRHSLSGGQVDPASVAFRDAVRASLDTPADILARLFSIRAAGLLQDLEPAAAAARLSGYLIGQEIAGAKARFALPDRVDLIGDPKLGALYGEALAIAGISGTLHDGDTAVIAGLAGAVSAPPKTGTDG
ncbi:MAG: 2-dehydro-3-deoxygalactonokinase [Ahrensia sp.]|nr:2-dehydro-3-deoxygalactonokinase [Ahrensia sp.]